MKIVLINTCLNGSTGKIMNAISDAASSNGNEVWVATSYARRKLSPNKHTDSPKYIVIGNFLSLYSHLLFGYLTGLKGCFSFFSTKAFLRKIKRIKPDIIHLHNLHDSFINLNLLFSYIKKNDIRVVWTLHDCWSFTGRCPYFDLTKCEKWKDGCKKCPYPRYKYPKTLINQTRKMWNLKKKWFSKVKKMMIVTPSAWLANLVGYSFLNEYPLTVINNGIDLNVFRPRQSDYRKRICGDSQFVILGVCFSWEERKGLDVFIELEKRLPNTYKIVLVGTSDAVDEKIPSSMVSIHQTQNQEELAVIYSMADLFVNPTREENFPTVNIESIACGTPVLTFKTGGSPEIIDESCGRVVECNDVDAMKREIISICSTKAFKSNSCVKRAKNFDNDVMANKYLELYNKMLH